MRWKEPKIGDKKPWKRVFTFRPHLIGDTWYWLERVYCRKVVVKWEDRNGKYFPEWRKEYGSPDMVVDILKGKSIKGVPGLNIDA